MHAQLAIAMIAGPNGGGLLCQGPLYCVELLLHCVGFVPARTFAHRGSWTPAVQLRDDALTRLLRPGIAVAFDAPSCQSPPEATKHTGLDDSNARSDYRELRHQRKRSGPRSRVCGRSNLQRFRVQSQNHSYGFALGKREFRKPIVLDLGNNDTGKSSAQVKSKLVKSSHLSYSWSLGLATSRLRAAEHIRKASC